MLLRLKQFQKLLILILIPIFMAACESDDEDEINSSSFSVVLSSKNTIPQVSAEGNGSATLTLNNDSGVLSGSITASGLTGAITAAHIHHAIAGSTGGIVVTLSQDSSNADQFNIPSGTTLSTSEQSALLNSEYYINVHTAANASGEVRGQIVATNQEVIRVELNGDNQIPTAVTTSNSGVAYITVNKSTREIRGNITNTGLDNATAIHIHDAFAGTNGSVVTGLTINTDVSVWDIDVNTILDSSQLSTLLAGGMYFNVHSSAFPNGEIRGQIIPEGIEHKRVKLNGDNQVPDAVSSAGSAIAYITVNKTSGGLTAHILTEGLTDTTAAHIHSGFAGSNGGLTLALTQDVDDFSTTTGDSLDSTALADLFAGKLYFNVHTDANPNGELRGQIEAGDIKVTRDVLDGSQSVPSVSTSATGIGYTTVDESNGTITANVRTSGVVATAAHIHEGATGNTGGIVLTLAQDGTDTDLWAANGSLDSTQLDAYKSSELYFNIHSDAHAPGEIRAQINH